VVNKAGLEQVFSIHFGFSCQAFHRLLHAHHQPLPFVSWYSRPVVAPVIVDSIPLYPPKMGGGKVELYLQFTYIMNYAREIFLHFIFTFYCVRYGNLYHKNFLCSFVSAPPEDIWPNFYNKNFVMNSCGARNRKRLRWRQPSAIH
jgi:hypothetical protein